MLDILDMKERGKNAMFIDSQSLPVLQTDELTFIFIWIEMEYPNLYFIYLGLSNLYGIFPR